MAGWHHWLDGRESEWTPGVGDGQEGLACYDSWGCKELDTTERLIWSDLILRLPLVLTYVTTDLSSTFHLPFLSSSLTLCTEGLCGSIAKSYSTLHDPMDCSTPGFSVPHHLLKFAWVHVHWIGDAIQQSHPLIMLLFCLLAFFF